MTMDYLKASIAEVSRVAELVKDTQPTWSGHLKAVAATAQEYIETGRSLYCTDCGSCGEPGCCPPEMCKRSSRLAAVGSSKEGK